MDLKTINEKIKKCKQCPLWRTRTNAVPGEGNEKAEIMFIGEAPGRSEDLQGRPFVGAAGKVLDDLLSAVGLKREDVYITNIVKCRPPKNRDPLLSEIEVCSPYLERQIEIIKPKIIVTLGRFSMQWIFEKFGLPQAKISQVHGKVFEVDHKFIRFIIPLYHPAVAVYNPKMKEILKRDMKKLKN